MGVIRTIKNSSLLILANRAEASLNVTLKIFPPAGIRYLRARAIDERRRLSDGGVHRFI